MARERGARLCLDTRLGELGLDSLEIMDVVARVENACRVRFAESLLTEVETCRDLAALYPAVAPPQLIPAHSELNRARWQDPLATVFRDLDGLTGRNIWLDTWQRALSACAILGPRSATTVPGDAVPAIPRASSPRKSSGKVRRDTRPSMTRCG